MVTTLWTVIKLQHRVREGEDKVNQMSWHVVGLLDSEMSLPLRRLSEQIRDSAHWSAVSVTVCAH